MVQNGVFYQNIKQIIPNIKYSYIIMANLTYRMYVHKGGRVFYAHFAKILVREKHRNININTYITNNVLSKAFKIDFG